MAILGDYCRFGMGLGSRLVMFVLTGDVFPHDLRHYRADAAAKPAAGPEVGNASLISRRGRDVAFDEAGDFGRRGFRCQTEERSQDGRLRFALQNVIALPYGHVFQRSFDKFGDFSELWLPSMRVPAEMEPRLIGGSHGFGGEVGTHWNDGEATIVNEV